MLSKWRLKLNNCCVFEVVCDAWGLFSLRAAESSRCGRSPTEGLLWLFYRRPHRPTTRLTTSEHFPFILCIMLLTSVFIFNIILLKLCSMQFALMQQVKYLKYCSPDWFLSESFGITLLRPCPDINSHWLSSKQDDDIIPTHLKSRKWESFPASEVIHNL